MAQAVRAAVGDLPPGIAPPDPLRGFKQRDATGRGVLSRAEFYAALSEVTPTLAGRAGQQLVDQLSDADGLVHYADRALAQLLVGTRPADELPEVYRLAAVARAHLERRMDVAAGLPAPHKELSIYQQLLNPAAEEADKEQIALYHERAAPPSR